MIQMQTIVDIADNTGAKTARCIKVLGGSKRRTAGLGDVVVVAVQKSIPSATVKKGTVAKGVIVRVPGCPRGGRTAATCGSTATRSC